MAQSACPPRTDAGRRAKGSSAMPRPDRGLTVSTSAGPTCSTTRWLSKPPVCRRTARQLLLLTAPRDGPACRSEPRRSRFGLQGIAVGQWAGRLECNTRSQSPPRRLFQASRLFFGRCPDAAIPLTASGPQRGGGRCVDGVVRRHRLAGADRDRRRGRDRKAWGRRWRLAAPAEVRQRLRVERQESPKAALKASLMQAPRSRISRSASCED